MRAEPAPAEAPDSDLDTDETSDDTLRHDTAVSEAFERLRAHGAVRVRPSGSIAFTSVPTIEGRHVVMREAVVVPGHAAPLHYAAGIDLARLTRIVANGADVPAIIAAYQQSVDPVPMAGVLTGLSLLVARQALVAEAD